MMRWLSSISYSLKALFTKRKLDEQLSAEIQAHVDLATEANMAEGMARDDARHAALREFGNVAGMQERARDERGWVWLEQLGQDVRYAIRGLVRNPNFTVVVVLTLALGMGANTALFSVLNGLLLRSLPVREPESLLMLTTKGLDFDRTYMLSNYQKFREQAATVSEIAAVAAWSADRQVRLPDDTTGDAMESSSFEVSGNFFSALGVSPVVGRALNEEDDQPGHPRAVTVVSYDFWRRHLGGDASAIGRTLLLDGFAVTVVGVAPPRFNGTVVGYRTDLWLPLQLSPQIDRHQPWGVDGLKSVFLLNLVARLSPGVSPKAAATELSSLFRQQLAQPGGLPSWHSALDEAALQRVAIELQPAGRGYGGLRSWLDRPVTLLTIMAGLLLLVSCANVAGLLIARSSNREKEFAMRAALGADGRRLFRQAMTESLLLACIGGIVGLAVAWAGVHGLGDFLGLVNLRPDGRVVSFLALIIGLTGFACGLMPAWRASRIDLVTPSRAMRRVSRLNHGLVVVQIGLAVSLGVISILLVRTFHNVASIDPGFPTRNLLVAPLVVDGSTTFEQRLELDRRLREAVAALPGVRHVSSERGLELIRSGSYQVEIQFDISAVASPQSIRPAYLVMAAPGFFQTMGIPLVRGRDFGGPADASSVVITEATARQLFGANDPIGQHVKLGTEREVIGVVRDIKFGSVRESPRLIAYVPMTMSSRVSQTTLVLQTEDAASVNLVDLRTILRRIEPTAALPVLNRVDDVLARKTRQEKIVAQLAGFFGLFVLLLACLGLFGVMTFNVNRMRREMGVRLALGASPSVLLRSVFGQGMRLVFAGALMGTLGALSLVRLAESVLYGVSSLDPKVYGAVLLLLSVTGLVACWLPAHRAAKVDPVIVLRTE